MNVFAVEGDNSYALVRVTAEEDGEACVGGSSSKRRPRT